MQLSKQHGPQQGAALRKRTIQPVGLDVHHATTVAGVRADSGRVIAETILPTEEAALGELFRRCGGRSRWPSSKGPSVSFKRPF